MRLGLTTTLIRGNRTTKNKEQVEGKIIQFGVHAGIG